MQEAPGQTPDTPCEIIDHVGIDDVAMDERQRGWRGSGRLICSHCVSDDYVKAVVAEAAVSEQVCSFCDTAPAAKFDVFMEALMVGVVNTFEQADGVGMPRDSGYVFDTYDSYELADEFSWVVAGEHADEVVGEIRGCLADKTYASRWWLELEPDRAYSAAWEKFREQILHRTRFVFWAARDNNVQHEGTGELPVARVLQAIGALLVKFDLVTTLPAGTLICRARGHARKQNSQGWGAADLGTKLPKDSMESSRMSPAGIPLFYGADDIETALAEVARVDSSEFFTVGEFATTAPMTIIDLTDVPAVPSIFDPKLGRWQGELRFLNALVNELREPVDMARSNLNYVPTQVFCEYFLRVFDEADIRGLAWKSAMAAGGGRCWALDVAHEDCVEVADSTAGRPQVELVAGSVTVHRRRADEFRQL
jgi:hypothetical protein